jgi:hypothetical protein
MDLSKVNPENHSHVVATIQLAHSNGPANSVGANFFALDIDAPGSPFLPGCSLHLPVGQSWITGFLVLLDGTGNGSTAWTLPTTYPGLFFVSQSVALDTTPLGLSLSNAGVAVLQ